MTSTRALVSVVDDHESVRESLPDLLQHSGFNVESFSSAEAFLESEAVSESSCLILDVGLPGMSGPDLQLELTRRGLGIPIVFITAQGDQSLRPKLIGLGATPVIGAFKKRVDHRRYNGATLLGLRGIVIKSHGSADTFAFEFAIQRAIEEARTGVLVHITERMAVIHKSAA